MLEGMVEIVQIPKPVDDNFVTLMMGGFRRIRDFKTERYSEYGYVSSSY